MSNGKVGPGEPVLQETKTATATPDTTHVPDPSLLHGAVGHVSEIVGPSRREEGAESKPKRRRRSGEQTRIVCSLGAGRDKHPLSLDNLLSHQDTAAEVLSRLSPESMLRIASASRNLRNQITSDGFRHHVRVRAGRTGRLLGVFVKATKASQGESYRYVECCNLPAACKHASRSIRQLWSSADTRPSNNWRYMELLDSRDGKLLMLAGNSPTNKELYICFPHSRKCRYLSVPAHESFRDPEVRLVTAAIVPEESTNDWQVIILARRGSADSKMKSDIPVSASAVLSYSSASGEWRTKSSMFRMPGKHMLRQGSIFVDGTLHFLQSSKRVITVHVESLDLGALELPSTDEAPNLASRTAHVLCRGPVEGIYLAVVSGRTVCVYLYTSEGWRLQQRLQGPKKIEARPTIRAEPLKLIGSSTGLLFLKSYAEDILGMNTETGKFNFLLAEDVREEEALAYEQECPPVSQMLERT